MNEGVVGSSNHGASVLKSEEEGKTEELTEGQRMLIRHATLFHGSPDPILLLSRMGRVLTVNQRTVEFFRVAEKRILKMFFRDLFELESRSALVELRGMGWSGVSEKRFTVEDGRTVSLNVSSILYEQDVAYALTVRDETTRLALENANEMRKQMDGIARLSSMLAMDLNDSITIVQGRLDLLVELEKQNVGGENRHLNIALDHVRRIAATMDNLRMVGRSGITTVESVLLDDVFKQALTLIGRRGGRRPIEAEFANLAVGGALASYSRVFANLLGYVLDTVRQDDSVVVRGFRKSRERIVVQMYGGPAVVGFDELLAVPLQEMRASGPTSTSLGFDVARVLVEHFGGTLKEWRAGSSVIVNLILPSAPGALSEVPRLDGRVLFVGKVQMSVMLAQLIGLSPKQYDSVPSAELALDVLANRHDFDAVAAELILPGMSGLTFAETLSGGEIPFDGRVAIVSESSVPQEAVPSGVEVLRPPWTQGLFFDALGFMR